ncbi:MAG: hypothetical protein F4X65_06500 [Chloroflexi bacterium]|nr:hypothetical protein [Chloroflexota bacterium]
MVDRPQQRESVWSVARRWVPWFLALLCLLTVGWTAFVFWVEATQHSYPTVSQLVIAAVNKAAPASPLIFLFAIVAVSVADSLEGMVVVTKRYLDNKLVEPIRNQLREEGRKEGTSEERERWEAWNRRRLEAEARGEPFNEPPPGTEHTEGQEDSGS